jgi:hypothetical protein
MLRKRKIDPLARQTVLAIAAGRTAIGVGVLLATRPALGGLGFAGTDVSSRALARLAGSRDIAVGLLTIAARDDADALRNAALLSLAVDASDAVSLGIAGRDPGARAAGLRGIASGGTAALAGAWAWRRLSA